MEKVDLVVIGSGQGGVPLAADYAREGRQVVLFERGALGGSCVNYGCLPSKAFLASAAVAARGGSRAATLGVRVETAVDFGRVMEHAREVIRGSSAGTGKRLEAAGVRVVNAEASFTGERQVAGGGAEFQAETVVIDTGSVPFVPPIPGLADTPFMTYRDFWGMEELPRKMLIIGGGYIGVELGQGMARLGSETHIVEMEERIISREEEDTSEVIAASLREDGVVLHLGARVESVSHRDGAFTLSLAGGEELAGDALLVAIGQRPATEALAADAGGVELDERGFVKVDERLQTSCPGVYAIGDVHGGPAFTHVAWEDYRRLKAILAGGERRAGDRVLAYAFFSDPQVGRVGLTREEAAARGLPAREVTIPLDWVAMAQISADTRGFYRLVVNEETEEILGATLVGVAAAELVHVILAHMEAGSSWRLLEQSVHVHPALAEGLPTLARQLLE